MISAENGPIAVEFDDLRLDLRAMAVRRNGVPVPLEPKALDVLAYLIAQRARVVTKDELLDAVWKDTFVTPNALTRVIALLRRSLGDAAEQPRLIETVSKRGYRFIGAVREIRETEGADVAVVGTVVASPPAPAAKRFFPWSIAALAIVLLVAGAGAAWRLLRQPPTPAGSRLLMTPITSSRDVIDAAVSPDGKYVAYVRSDRGMQGLWIRQIGGANPIALVPAAPVGYFGVSFAPDSSSIYYVLRGPTPLASPSGTLYQIPVLGGAPRSLGTAFDNFVMPSPDGRFLASLRGSYPNAGESAVVLTNADGSNPHPLATVHVPELLAPGFFVAPSWSPGSDRIAVSIRAADQREAYLATIDVPSGAIHRFPARLADAAFTAWLPDNTGIVFVGSDRQDSRRELGNQLWLQPLPDGPPRPLTTGLVDFRTASVTADSSKLVTVGSVYDGAFWTIPLDGHGKPVKLPSLKNDGFAGLCWLGDDQILFTSVDSGRPELWTMNRDGSGRHQLTTTGWSMWPRPTRDGRTIYFVSLQHNELGIWRMARDGSGARLVTTASQPLDLMLTPDERSIVFSANADGLPSTWIVSVDGGTPRLLVQGMTRPGISPDGTRVAGIWQPSPSRTPALAVFSLAGGDPLQTFEGPFTATSAGGVWWSADGSALRYTTAERANVWRQDLKGGAPVRVTDLDDGVIIRADLTPDRRTLLTFRGNQSRDAFLLTGFR